jgi:hypothetical protein
MKMLYRYNITSDLEVPDFDEEDGYMVRDRSMKTIRRICEGDGCFFRPIWRR